MLSTALLWFGCHFRTRIGKPRSAGHLLLAMITSARQSSWPLDWPIEDLLAAGLPQPCVVRLKLFTLDERLVLGRLGALVAADRTAVAAQLAKLLAPAP